MPHPQRKKKWTEYLWEFLILFLAVFCGFLAENQRKKQYIRSLISDGKADTTNITSGLKWYYKIKKSCDTVLDHFDSFSKDYSIKTTNNYFNAIGGFPDCIYTNRMMQELKNSGGMRLIRNAGTTDGIIAYDAAVRDILIEETPITSCYEQLNDLTNKMLSYKKIVAAFKI